MNLHSNIFFERTAVAEPSAQPLVAKIGKSKRTFKSAAVEVKPEMQPVSERFPALEEQEIILTYFDPMAKEVKLAGNFNNWRPDSTPLKNTGAGEWIVRLRLRSGQYEYRFVVDGQWREDPQVSQRTANPHGGFNSVFLVPLSVKTSML